MEICVHMQNVYSTTGDMYSLQQELLYKIMMEQQNLQVSVCSCVCECESVRVCECCCTMHPYMCVTLIVVFQHTEAYVFRIASPKRDPHL